MDTINMLFNTYGFIPRSAGNWSSQTIYLAMIANLITVVICILIPLTIFYAKRLTWERLKRDSTLRIIAAIFLINVGVNTLFTGILSFYFPAENLFTLAAVSLCIISICLFIRLININIHDELEVLRHDRIHKV